MADLAEAAGADISKGDRLLSLYEQQWATAYAMELLRGVMQATSVDERARALALEYEVGGSADSLPRRQLADIGASLLSGFLDHDSAKQSFSAVSDERARVEAELLELCNGHQG